LTQWYPKPAVYDSRGWHTMPYLDQGEFYSEFGNYNVHISVPKDYVVASTGVLKNTIETDSVKTLHYQQNNIHDFAWFADKDFEVLHDTLQLKTKIIDVYAYYNPSGRKYWTNSIRYIKSAIKTKSEWLGEYPYPVVSVVEKPGISDAGGMEYPTITLITRTMDEKMLDFLINHEVGHNWFYGILASNERTHPWMDEGMNSYYDERYSQMHYGDSGLNYFEGNGAFFEKRNPHDIQVTALHTITGMKKDQPIETESHVFSEINYGLIAYSKAAQWMQGLEKELGTPLFDSMMQHYYEKFKFKHPYPADFKATAEAVSGKNLDDYFSLLYTKGSLQKPVKKDLRVTSFFSLKETDKHQYIFVAPAVGYNFYDKFMLGVFLHNYTLPFTKLQFFAAPMYAPSSKQFNGLGRISYSWFPGNNGQKAEIAVAGARFTADSFTDSTGTKNYQPIAKIAPSFKFTFANKNARSTLTKFIQWKTFFIEETGLLFTRDTIQQIDVISYPKAKRYVNQLQFVISNSRVLYPYDGALQVEQGDGFVRTNFTGNYFFNYAKGGGVNVRLFAGKFFYTGDRTFLTQFKTDRYHLNMTGPKGYEDYTYNNYFMGRNEFEGFANQQIMMRDGAFKVRTDLLSSKIGKTDNWLAALIFNSSIPKNINPLELMPFKIPLKVFADIGT
ncbi:MAG TPA: M1 family metallopeptidase, partial [Ferruginibacter sp.]|nr:M1 family metallopeptidase [Ferruginibacter sp.]